LGDTVLCKVTPVILVPCKVTPVVLHGFVSPEPGVTLHGVVSPEPGVTLHGVVSPEQLTWRCVCERESDIRVCVSEYVCVSVCVCERETICVNLCVCVSGVTRDTTP
jgi:hypothetical protein